MEVTTVGCSAEDDRHDGGVPDRVRGVLAPLIARLRQRVLALSWRYRIEHSRNNGHSCPSTDILQIIRARPLLGAGFFRLGDLVPLRQQTSLLLSQVTGMTGACSTGCNTKGGERVICEPPHSAAGQALGYVHQCMWALIELGRRANLEPALQLRLEALDDIEFDAEGSPAELLQTKHHKRNSGSVTANTVDLWRTLNVWMGLDNTDKLILRFITTQNLHDDSGLVHLRSVGNKRNTSAAMEELLTVATESTNSTTATWRQRFRELDDDKREELVDRIIIEDGSTHASEIDSELTKIFRYAYPPGRDEVFVQLLKGWWYGIAVRLLDRSLETVTGQDLIAQVNEISDQLKSDSLPVDPRIMQEYDESIAEIYKDREFVQQLLWIALDDNRLWKAIRDYHRSFTQRSFWLRHQLLGESELNHFAFRLHDEWEHIFDSQVARMQRTARNDSEIVGQEVLESLVRESRARLRDRFDEPWFNRGMFHALADGELGFRVGWHPEFESKLEGLLSHVAID